MRDTKISWAHVLTSRRPVWNDLRTGQGFKPSGPVSCPRKPSHRPQATVQLHLLKKPWWSCFEAYGYSHLTSSL
jgi:hypothetical protein